MDTTLLSITLAASCCTLVVSLFGSSFYRYLFNKLKVSNTFKGQDITESKYEEFVSQLSIAVQWLSERRIGALIVVENKQNLDQYVALGYSVTAKFNPEFLINIFFNKASSLHDGGVIIRGFEIVSISSYFPITKTQMNTSHGARHRAAAGITEQTDATAFVVTETHGHILVAQKGKLDDISDSNLSNISQSIYDKLSYYID